ncbi:MAG: transglutaminase-like domain-containing protein [Eubacteriales bacterium]|nr:transglutaminase-like domain-containing protein [Eubacteriales bacterium]
MMSDKLFHFSARTIACILCAVLLFTCAGQAPEAHASLSDLFSKISGKSSVPKAVEGKTMADVTLLTPNEAPGTAVESCDVATVDYSNICDGYVMVKYTAQTSNRIKCQIYGPSETYPYTLTPGEWAALPLSEGDGEYRVSILENIGGTKYAQVLSCAFYASLTSEFGPFLRSNLYVNYEKAPNAIATAEMLTEGITDTLEKVNVIYDFVIKTLTYDKQLAATVTSGYVSDIDSVLAAKCGICFDYASLMTGMLRCSGVPCRMIFGYTGELYHAWISVWVEGEGWVDDIIRFNGEEWERMDPTFASANTSKAVVEYVGNEDNYTAKYFY